MRKQRKRTMRARAADRSSRRAQGSSFGSRLIGWLIKGIFEGLAAAFAMALALTPILGLSSEARAQAGPFQPITEKVKAMNVTVTPGLAAAAPGGLRLTVLYAVGSRAGIVVNERQVQLRKITWLADKGATPGSSVAINEVTLVKEGLNAPANLVIFVLRSAATPLTLPLWLNGDGSAPDLSDALEQAISAGRVPLANAAMNGQGLERALAVKVLTLDELKALDREQGSPNQLQVQM